MLPYSTRSIGMYFEGDAAQRPDDWPANTREQDLELIDKAINEFEAKVGCIYRIMFREKNLTLS